MRTHSILLFSVLLALTSSAAFAQQDKIEAAEKKAERAKAKTEKAAAKAAKQAEKAGEKVAAKAEEGAEKSAAAMPSHEEMMQAWEEAATPGPEHEKLAKAAGTWSMTMTDYMAPGEPTTSEGTAERKMILGDRVLVENVESEMAGMSFKGLGHTGFDNVTGKYWSTWMDDMSTGFAHRTAEPTEGDEMTWMGKSSNPMAGKEVEMKIVSTQVSEDEERMVFYMPGPDGNMIKTMEIVYERQQ